MLSSSGFPLFYYLFVTSLLCSWLELFPLLFVTSNCYLFRVSIVLLSVCYVIALFSTSTPCHCLATALYEMKNLLFSWFSPTTNGCFSLVDLGVDPKMLTWVVLGTLKSSRVYLASSTRSRMKN